MYLNRPTKKRSKGRKRGQLFLYVFNQEVVAPCYCRYLHTSCMYVAYLAPRDSRPTEVTHLP